VTAQFPDKLVNNHPRVKFDGLHLYGVVRGPAESSGGWGEDRAFATAPSPPGNVMCTGLWRGYVATFVLQEDGRLRLTAFEYLADLSDWQKQDVDELLVGDFRMVLAPEFFGRRTYVPFRDGAIVEDREEWFTEDPFEVGAQNRRNKQEGSP
jgi:hypothetical protein